MNILKRKDCLNTTLLFRILIKKFKHFSHSKDKQLNNIIDLIVNLGENLDRNISTDNRKIETVLEI